MPIFIAMNQFDVDPAHGAEFEERWRDVGFVRIHRRHLIALHHIDEVRWEAGHCTVRIGDTDLAVSRRHTRELRDVLVRRAQP